MVTIRGAQVEVLSLPPDGVEVAAVAFPGSLEPGRR